MILPTTQQVSTNSKRSAGFTYIELIIVLVLLALSASVVMPTVEQSSGRTALRLIAADIESTMRQARSNAMRANISSSVTFNLKSRQYWSGSASRTKSIDPRVSIRIESVAGETRDGDNAKIRFLPDGSSSGGTLWLSSGPAQLRMDIDWMTGHTRIRSGT